MNFLVTGGAGFIGSNLVDFLLSENHKVRVLDDLSTGSLKNLENCINKIEFIKGDIRDFKTCLTGTKDLDGVFHLAALGSVPRSIEKPEDTISVNIIGTTNIFSACVKNKIKKVVFASSSSVYGDSLELPKKEGRVGKPLSPYAYSKKSNEEMANLFYEIYGLNFIGLRYFNVYGIKQNPEGPYAAVIPRFFKNCIKGKPPEIYGDGKQTRDFTYVMDAVRGTVNAMFSKDQSWNRVYNISGGKNISILSLAEEFLKLFNLNLKPIFLEERKGDIKHSLADLTLAKEFLNYKQLVDLKEGLIKSKKYYEDLFL